MTDLIFTQRSSGQVGDWVLNNGAPVAYPIIGQESDRDWQIVGAR